MIQTNTNPTNGLTSSSSSSNGLKLAANKSLLVSSPLQAPSPLASSSLAILRHKAQILNDTCPDLCPSLTEDHPLPIMDLNYDQNKPG
jgi:hypothetical protein